MKIIVFSGLPGTGKSRLAEALGTQIHAPVFAKDWLEATLLRCGVQPAREDGSLGFAAYELLTVLAERQLMRGQSVILDSVAATRSIRQAWRRLADRYRADCRVIECICSDASLHRARLRERQRKIPGWHELEWSEVERVRSYYLPWEGERLVLDMVRPFDENLVKARLYCE